MIDIGRVNYEAYCLPLRGEFSAWEDLSKDIQDAWRKAAAAVYMRLKEIEINDRGLI
jgi:hypothetical protein